MRRLFGRTFIITSLTLLGLAVHAQEIEFSVANAVTKWSEETQIIVLPSAEKVALDAAAFQFGSQAIAAGVAPVEAARFARSISEGAYIATTPDGLIGKWQTGEAALRLTDSAQAIAVKGALSGELVALQLRTLPRITITVEPVPPRDYLIKINNQSARARERKSEVFAVEPGAVTVRVSRKDKPDCTWQGQMALGDEQSVHCQM
jgi:hypothetical protein